MGRGRENPADGALHLGYQPWELSPLQARRDSGREEPLNPERDAWRETLCSLSFCVSSSCWGFSLVEPTGSWGRGVLRFTPWLFLQDGFGGAVKEAHVTCPPGASSVSLHGGWVLEAPYFLSKTPSSPPLHTHCSPLSASKPSELICL